jgi:hypothetical protein
MIIEHNGLCGRHAAEGPSDSRKTKHNRPPEPGSSGVCVCFAVPETGLSPATGSHASPPRRPDPSTQQCRRCVRASGMPWPGVRLQKRRPPSKAKQSERRRVSKLARKVDVRFAKLTPVLPRSCALRCCIKLQQIRQRPENRGLHARGAPPKGSRKTQERQPTMLTLSRCSKQTVKKPRAIHESPQKRQPWNQTKHSEQWHVSTHSDLHF